MIRKITEKDRALFLRLSEEFYRSDAVSHAIPSSHHERAFEEVMRTDTYTEAFFIECGGEVAGYLLTSNAYSREAGGMMLWVEELYLMPQYRGRGLGQEAFAFIEQKAKQEDLRRIRLDVCESNRRAIALYERLGFGELEYKQMIKDL